MKCRSLPAFTLPEIAVALLLTALLAVLVYGGLNTIQGQARLIAGTGQPVREVLRLATALRADAQACDHIALDGAAVTFAGRRRYVRYTLADSLLVRHTDFAAPDTFRLQTDSLRWRPVAGNTHDGRIPVTDLTVYIRLPGRRTSCITVSRYYAAQQLMEFTATAHERN